MEHKRPPIQVIVVIVVVLLIAGYYGFRAIIGNAGGTLTASGTIETTQVSIGPEIAGKVSEVLVREGAPVEMGDVLFRLFPAGR
jgi:multidrug resistance efflux pump